jgi:hypothetical protein
MFACQNARLYPGLVVTVQLFLHMCILVKLQQGENDLRVSWFRVLYQPGIFLFFFFSVVEKVVCCMHV